MPQLLHTGTGYNGYDGLHKRVLRVAQGAVVDVSAPKAQQLLTDFPHEWEPVADKPVETPAFAAWTPPAATTTTKQAKPRKTKPVEPQHTKG